MSTFLLPRFFVLAGLFLLLASAVAVPICSTYTVAGGDTCTKIASSHGITVDNIEDYNTQTWGWHGCARMQQGDFMCVSSGDPPMPVALPHATCGPQVPGTVRPQKYSDLASLNPCPVNQCCSEIGQCGTTSAFCSAAEGCIQNCKADADTQPAQSASTASKPNEDAVVKATSASAKKSITEMAESTSSTKSTTTEHTTTTTSNPSKTTTSAATSSSAHWQLTMYSKKNCEGDYYLLQGHNTWFDKCLRLQSDLSTIVSDTEVSCRWWVDGGFNWTSCDKSDLTKPRSWFMNSGSCWVYPDSTCNEYSGSINEGTHLGCQSEHTMATEPDTVFGSLKCAQLQR